MLWLYERKFVSLSRQTKATATASEQTKAFVLQSNGASSPTGLRQTESSGSAFRVNKNQSYRGRLTTRISRILLTRQLGTVVRRETDNPNQRSTHHNTHICVGREKEEARKEVARGGRKHADVFLEAINFSLFGI